MPSDVRNRSPSPPSRGAAGPDRHNRSRSPKRVRSGADSPAEGHRYRSRSPKPRSPPANEEAKPRTRKVASGFKFKERSSGEGHNDQDRGQVTKGLERGYRDKGGEGRFRSSVPSSDAISEKFGAGTSVKDKFGDVKVAEATGNPTTVDKPVEARKEKRKEQSKPSVKQPALEMIVVYVNDRLGTRAQIMCSPSDTIKDFKAFTAQKIGRKPHEIMVKRQGERPFRDQLTLEDYGVGNGVQLDLELDTGD